MVKRTRWVVPMLTALVILLMTVMAAPASASAPRVDRHPDVHGNYGARCLNTVPPGWFYPEIGQAAYLAGTQLFAIFDQAVAMARIACWESNYYDHAVNGQYLGRWQLNLADINNAGISYSYYWNGGSFFGTWFNDGFWQDFAAMKYIQSRYGNPVNAWNHEVAYGWY